MSNDQASQEARRALADMIEACVDTQRKPVVGVAATPEFWRIAIDALRSDPARVAEENEALADKLAEIADGDLREYARESLIGIHPDQQELRGWADLMDKAAAALRADPLPQETGESDG